MSTLRHVMYKKLAPTETLSTDDFRTVTEADNLLLGQLMYSSYQGTIDYDGETLEQSIQEMTETLSGKYGKVISPASLVIVDGDVAVAAVIFVFYAKEAMPLLTFTMTHPQHQGRGLAQRLINSSLRVLHEQSFDQCCLVVTEGNRPAQDIYKKLGFTTTKA